MAFSLGGLLQGLTSAAVGGQRGVADRRELERKALQELMAQRLQEAQLSNFADQQTDRAGQRAAAAADAQRRDALRASNPEYANLPDDVLDTVAGRAPVSEGSGNYFTDDAGNVTYSVAGGPGRPVSGVQGKSKPPTMGNADQTKLADFGTRMLEGHAIMSRLERSNPGIGQRVDAKVRPILTAEVVPGLGKAMSRAISPAVLSAMTPNERAYWGALQDVVNARLRRVTGAAINAEELEREARPIIPLAGEDAASVEAKRARRLQGALLYIHGAGPAFSPSLLSQEAGAYLQQQPDAAPQPEQPSRPNVRPGDWRALRPR